MKKFFLATLFLGMALSTFAQKIGIVDTQYLLNEMPQYREAQSRLDAQVKAWQADAQSLQDSYDRKKAALENERVLLLGDQLSKREAEVRDLDDQLKNTLSLRFGTNGEIEKLRSNLIKPYQDQIWEAIRQVAEKNGLGIVIDKNADVNVLYVKRLYDYTEKVLEFLTKATPKKPTGKKN